MNPLPDFGFWLHMFGWLAGAATLPIALAAWAARATRQPDWRRAVWQATFFAIALILAAELTGLDDSLARRLAPPSKSARSVAARGNLPVTLDTGRAPAPALAAPPTFLHPAAPEENSPTARWWPGGLWLFGSVLLLARFAGSRLLLLALARRRSCVVNEALVQQVEMVRRRLGWNRSVRLQQFNGLRSPIAFGLVRPTIGLPAGFGERFSPAEQQTILAHELAHLAARDPLWYGLAEIVTALLWWHPLVWWARRAFHSASELAADEASLIVDDGPAVLAGCLVALGRQVSQRQSLGWLGIEGGYRSGLGRRVERLLQLDPATRQPATRRAKLALVACVGIVVALLVTASAWATPDGATTSLTGLLAQVLAGPEPVKPPGVAARTSPRPLPAVATNKLAAATLVQDGKLLYEMGRMEEAELRLTQALRQDSDNQAARYYLGLVKTARSVGAGISAPAPSASGQTNLVRTSPGRQRIVQALNRIQLGPVPLANVPLEEALRILSYEVKRLDPLGVGVNFIIQNGAPSASPTPTIDPATGLPMAWPPTNAGPVDLGKVRIIVQPPWQEVTLGEALDAIVKAADQPIRYAIEDFAVVFSAKRKDAAPPLYTRVFKVDPNTFLEALERAAASQSGNAINPATGLPLAPSGDPGTGQGVPPAAAKTQQTLRDFFTVSGVDLAPGTGKTVFFNDRQGMLLVRATLQDLDLIESMIQTLNAAPAQVVVQVKIVEITQADSAALGFDWYLGNLRSSPTNPATATAAGSPTVFPGMVRGTIPPTSLSPPRSAVPPVFPGAFPGSTPAPFAASPTAPPQDIVPREVRGDELDWPGRDATNAHNVRVSATSGISLSGILTEPQYKIVLRALEQRHGAEVLSAPSVTTLSGRQAQIRIADMNTIVTGVDSTAGEGRPTTAVIPCGPVLDVVPRVLPDGYTVQLNLTAKLTEFLGYDPTGQLTSPAVLSGKAQPAPRFRVRDMTTTANVWDGQTLILGGPIVDVKARGTNSPAGGQTGRKLLLIFVTATIIDPAGNRVHTDDEMPFSTNQAPAQPRK